MSKKKWQIVNIKDRLPLLLNMIESRARSWLAVHKKYHIPIHEADPTKSPLSVLGDSLANESHDATQLLCHVLEIRDAVRVKNYSKAICEAFKAGERHAILSVRPAQRYADKQYKGGKAGAEKGNKTIVANSAALAKKIEREFHRQIELRGGRRAVKWKSLYACISQVCGCSDRKVEQVVSTIKNKSGAKR
jgi:hypothetical protein